MVLQLPQGVCLVQNLGGTLGVRWYSDIIFPLPFLLLAVSSLALFAAA